ncbi:MAG: hypothetical protein RLZZ265_1972 [Verrucomicrobiota bacterium]
MLLGGGVGQLPGGLDALSLGALEVQPRLQAGGFGGGGGEPLAQFGLGLGQGGLQLLAAGAFSAQGGAGGLQLRGEQGDPLLRGAAGLEQ